MPESCCIPKVASTSLIGYGVGWVGLGMRDWFSFQFHAQANNDDIETVASLWVGSWGQFTDKAVLTIMNDFAPVSKWIVKRAKIAARNLYGICKFVDIAGALTVFRARKSLDFMIMQFKSRGEKPELEPAPVSVEAELPVEKVTEASAASGFNTDEQQLMRGLSTPYAWEWDQFYPFHHPPHPQLHPQRVLQEFGYWPHMMEGGGDSLYTADPWPRHETNDEYSYGYSHFATPSMFHHWPYPPPPPQAFQALDSGDGGSPHYYPYSHMPLQWHCGGGQGFMSAQQQAASFVGTGQVRHAAED